MAHPTGPRLVLGLIIGVVAAQALMLFAFAWPAVNSGPREVPIAVAGPPEAVGQIEQGLASVPSRDADVPAFDVVRVDDEAAATEAIADRDVYGAVVLSQEGPRVLVASGASPGVAQALRATATELAPDGAGVAVQDVVPTTPDDPTGAGLAVGVLPLIMTSAAGGFGIGLLLARRGERFVAVVGLAAVAGLSSAALLTYGLGVVDDGSYWELAGVVALVIGAVSATVAGLTAVLGRAGGVLGILLMIFLGNPFSAAASAPEFLPQPWGEIGQLLPPGAGVSAVRSVGYFDGAAAGQPLLVLSIWLAAGLLLVLARRPGRGTVEVDEDGNVPERGTSEARSSAGA